MQAQLALFPGLVTTTAAPADEVAPSIVLPGQLQLFEGEAAQIAQIASMLDRAEFADAMQRLQHLEKSRSADATAWRTRLAEVVDAVTAAGKRADHLARVAQEWEDQPSRRGLPLSLTWAMTRGLHRATAEAGEATQSGAIILDRPAGWHWLRAGRLDEARRSLEASVVGNRLPGVALVLLGNLAWRAGDAAEARLRYCEAMLRDPPGVPFAEIADDATRELIEQAREQNLAPASAWAPIAGFVAEHFTALPQTSADETVAQFQTTLASSREATKRGQPDAKLRKELKAMAPTLFKALLDSGRV